jgi:ankyrin repeat protein
MSQMLPLRPDLDWYRKAAKKNLRTLRSRDPKAKLAVAQLSVARKHGFASWRELKNRIESLSAPVDATTFIEAIRKGDQKTVAKLLMSNPSLVNGCDAHGAPALTVAVGEDEPSIVRLLLDHGADVTARYGRSAHTPLSWAMTIGSYKAANVLLKSGVKPDLFCAAGLNAVEVLTTFFDRNGRAIIGSSMTGSASITASRCDGTGIRCTLYCMS